MNRYAFVAGLSLVAAVAAPAVVLAQDAVTADPAHYKVELENDEVRVLRVRYGPGEKSVMHSHGRHVAIFVTGASATMTTPDGKTEPMTREQGNVMWSDGTTHLPANTGEAFEVVLVELKQPAAK